MDRANRLLFILIALMLFAAGIGGVAVGLGGFGPGSRDIPLFPSSSSQQWTLAVGLALVGLVLAWLGWRLVRAELRVIVGQAMADIEFPSPTSSARGQTRLRRSALENAVRRDLEHVPGVERTSIGLSGSPRSPDLHVQLSVDEQAALADVRAGVERSLQRMAATTHSRPRFQDLEIRLVRRSVASRVK